ncbi:hypothetical protein B0H14DRAFT_2632100 [Mycena olivaceomarginata]|nr:hypothetical protein B0H14DRAFT_2632100 [Mycena olivaceomarginata]
MEGKACTRWYQNFRRFGPGEVPWLSGFSLERVLAIILVDLGMRRGTILLDSNVDLGRPQSDPLHAGVSLTPVLPPMVALELSKREAQARYRARNQEELQRKAREAMARRRALLQQSDTNQARYAAREEAARYRAKNRDILAQKARVRRARNSIDKIGYEKWVAKYRKRHSGPIPAILESEYSSPERLPGPSKPPAQPNRDRQCDDYRPKGQAWRPRLTNLGVGKTPRHVSP